MEENGKSYAFNTYLYSKISSDIQINYRSLQKFGLRHIQYLKKIYSCSYKFCQKNPGWYLYTYVKEQEPQNSFVC